jgi:uncharacterized membrane protein
MDQGSRPKKKKMIRVKKSRAKNENQTQGETDVQGVYEKYYQEHRKKLGIEKYDHEISYIGSALNERFNFMLIHLNSKKDPTFNHLSTVIFSNQ